VATVVAAFIALLGTLMGTAVRWRSGKHRQLNLIREVAGAIESVSAVDSPEAKAALKDSLRILTKRFALGVEEEAPIRMAPWVLLVALAVIVPAYVVHGSASDVASWLGTSEKEVDSFVSSFAIDVAFLAWLFVALAFVTKGLTKWLRRFSWFSRLSRRGSDPWPVSDPWPPEDAESSGEHHGQVPGPSSDGGNVPEAPING